VKQHNRKREPPWRILKLADKIMKKSTENENGHRNLRKARMAKSHGHDYAGLTPAQSHFSIFMKWDWDPLNPA
jgi:hypothetical protein